MLIIDVSMIKDGEVGKFVETIQKYNKELCVEFLTWYKTLSDKDKSTIIDNRELPYTFLYDMFVKEKWDSAVKEVNADRT